MTQIPSKQEHCCPPNRKKQFIENICHLRPLQLDWGHLAKNTKEVPSFTLTAVKEPARMEDNFFKQARIHPFAQTANEWPTSQLGC